jgi:hypothetical protein
MSFTTPDFADAVIEALIAKGYEVCECDDGFWFTWTPPAGLGKPAVGETYTDQLGAYLAALQHWLANTRINVKATTDEIDLARRKYAYGSSDDVEVDDDAQASHGDDGTWVSAWVWLAHENSDDDPGDDFDSRSVQIFPDPFTHPAPKGT